MNDLQQLWESSLRDIAELPEDEVQEYPLSIQVRSDWVTPGSEMEPNQYEILITTGGPGVRVVGDLGRCQEPETATLEVQGWFKPWTGGFQTEVDDEVLLNFASQFYYG